MTLKELATNLKNKNSDAPLVFSTREESIGAGYHVTELKASDITSIDCGGRVTQWTETSLQLLDGNDGEYMKVGKFLGILKHSLATIPALQNAPTSVEFAPKNEGLRKFELSLRESEAETAEIELLDMRALCKPAQSRHIALASSDQALLGDSGCCGGPEQPHLSGPY